VTHVHCCDEVDPSTVCPDPNAHEAEARAGAARTEAMSLGADIDIRHALWVLHPHDGKYGDDGEMQCRGIDFLRGDLHDLAEHSIVSWRESHFGRASAEPVGRPDFRVHPRCAGSCQRRAGAERNGGSPRRSRRVTSERVDK
jgi:hypothetical protein